MPIGYVRVENWAPGALVAGNRPMQAFGDFSVPIRVSGIYREGNGSANGTLTAWVRSRNSGGDGAGKQAVFEAILTTDNLFNQALAGGRHLSNIVLNPGEELLLQIVATGNVAAETWKVVFELPDLPRSVRDAMMDAARSVVVSPARPK